MRSSCLVQKGKGFVPSCQLRLPVCRSSPAAFDPACGSQAGSEAALYRGLGANGASAGRGSGGAEG